MKARICLQSRYARGGYAAAPMAPAGPYLGAAEGAEQRIDLVDAADELGPAQPGASGELIVILAAPHWQLAAFDRWKRAGNR